MKRGKGILPQRSWWSQWSERWAKQWRSWWERWQAQWLFHLGVLALSRGKYQRAAELLEQVVRQLPENPFVHAHLGWAHWFLGHPVTARRHLLKATELAPNNPALWTLAGKLMALRGKWEEAEMLLRQAVALAPTNLVAQSWLTFVLLQRQLVAEALDILKRLPVADDPYLQARIVLHLERLVMERGERRGTSFPLPPRWMRFPFLAPFLGWLFRWRGERLLEDGAWKGAAHYLGLAASLRPYDLWAKLLWALALLEGGYWSQAERVLTEMPETIPERRWVYGALLVRQQRVKEGFSQLPKAEPLHPFVRYYLALALDWVGDAEYACVAHLEPLYREDPSALRQRIRELVRWLTEVP